MKDVVRVLFTIFGVPLLFICIVWLFCEIRDIRKKLDKPIAVKRETIYKEQVGLRVDTTDRLLVSRKYYELFHKDAPAYENKIKLDVTINHELYLGEFAFAIDDTLRSDYLVGAKFLKRNGIYYSVYDNKAYCLYTHNDWDAFAYEQGLSLYAKKEYDEAVRIFEDLCDRKVLSKYVLWDAKAVFANSGKGVDEIHRLIYLADKAERSDISYDMHYCVNLSLF